MRPCARGHRCAARTITATGPTPALSWRPFCDADRDLIETALTGMPALYVRVAELLGTRTSSGTPDDIRVAMSKAPPVPINLAADETARAIVEALVSWEERIRDVARLAPLDTAASRARRDGVAVVQAARTLAPRVDALVVLPAAPMMRGGDLLDLDGIDAGLEVLHLRRRACQLLPEADAPARPIPGVACGACGWRSLSEHLDELGYLDGARCRNCGTRTDAAGLAALRAAAVARAKARAGRP
ncbi:hypothetical protein ACFY19_20820 [Streptosporangium saharense]|uniref:hypothetical protein n=1 Tax=Streptosporangium saharense TaxID=1706840 RepID=UPI0036CC929E